MPNPFLQGHHAPVDDEAVAFDLPLEGELPAGLNGLYARTGSNPHLQHRSDHLHRLTGDGMVHGVRLQGGRCAWFRSRWVRSPDVARALGCEAPDAPDALVPEGTGNASLLAHAGGLYAFSEMALPYRLSGTLETLDISDFGGPMPAGSIAHPHVDGHSGELHTLAYHPESPCLRHHVVDARGRITDHRVLPVERPTLVHDFGLTATDLVVFDLPVLFSEEAMLDGEPLPYRWMPQAPARLGLVPRAGDPAQARWWDLDPCWVVHVAAVRVVGRSIEVDAIRRESLFASDLRGDGEGAPELVRCRLEPGRDRALVDVQSPVSQDFPMRDPRCPPGADTRLWTLALAADGHGRMPAGDRVLCHDLERDRCSSETLPAGWLASELTFVPRHPRAALGDGWLMGFLHARDSGLCRFSVFDANAVQAGPVASVPLPVRVPFGSHGCWVEDGQ